MAIKARDSQQKQWDERMAAVPSHPAEAHWCLLDQMVPKPKGWALIVADQGAGRGKIGLGLGMGMGMGLEMRLGMGMRMGLGVKDADEEKISVLVWMRMSRINAA